MVLSTLRVIQRVVPTTSRRMTDRISHRVVLRVVHRMAHRSIYQKSRRMINSLVRCPSIVEHSTTEVERTTQRL
jgi:hypothetical protein